MGFRSEITMNVDAKRRVSLPSAFRDVFPETERDRFVVYPSNRPHCLNANSVAGFEALLGAMEQQMAARTDPLLRALDDTMDDPVGELSSQAVTLLLDVEGRFVVPKDMLEELGVGGAILFSGRRDKFQLWQPEAFAAAFGDRAVRRQRLIDRLKAGGGL